MITEILIICTTVYLLLSPVVFAWASLIREQAHRLEVETDHLDFVDTTNIPLGKD